MALANSCLNSWTMKIAARDMKRAWKMMKLR
jgi:hypothetical protein